MKSIRITFVDGIEKIFREQGRAGGSYTLELKYEGGFAIVTDEWGNTNAFPECRILEIATTAGRS